MHRFETRVEPHGKTATFFHVPAEVMEALGPKKRVPVRVTVNGYTYRSTVAPMGGDFLLPLNREHRSGAGLVAGEVVEVAIERDDAPRVVEVPEDLAAALAAEPAAQQAFHDLDGRNRYAVLHRVATAATPQTRARRIAAAVQMLADGRRPY